MSVHDLPLEIVLAALGLLVLVLQAVRPFKNVRALGLGLAVVVVTLLVASLKLLPEAAPLLGGLYLRDAFALFFQRLFLAITALVLVIAAEFSRKHPEGAAEFYVIALFAATGMLFCAAVNDFILLFVALELVTVGFYVLVSYLRRDTGSLEAGMKYLIFGALASGVLVYGIAYVFGTTGATNFHAIAAALTNPDIANSHALGLGLLLVLAGLCFKIAAVPAQMWAPDVYQGAPTPTTAFLAVGSKTAGFVLLIRVYMTCFVHSAFAGTMIMLILVLAAISLLYGNLGAIRQTNLKRLFGYSSIAHAGYLLLGFSLPFSTRVMLPGTDVALSGIGAMSFYLAQYAFTNLCAFLVLVVVGNAMDGADIVSLKGLHRRSPVLAAALALSMLSLAGVPPTGGFIGKILLLLAVLASHNPLAVPLVIVACVGVLVSLYYYFQVIRAAYFDDTTDVSPIRVPFSVGLVLVVCIAVILLTGLLPLPLIHFAQNAAASLGPP